MNTTETRTVHVVKFYAATARLLSLNDGGHWATRAKNVQAWRWAAFIAACEQLPRRQRTSGLWLVAVSLPVVDRRRRDPHNFVATLKPIIDGITDTGRCWDDDDGSQVATLEPELRYCYPTEDVRVWVTITAPADPHGPLREMAA